MVQTVTQTLSGAVVIEEFQLTAGRPITLEGGQRWTWLTRADLDILAELLSAATVCTLTLHDGVARRVTPRRTDGPPWRTTQLPSVGDSGRADPSAGTLYVIEELRFLEIPA
jgi:hypothetical protein